MLAVQLQQNEAVAENDEVSEAEVDVAERPQYSLDRTWLLMRGRRSFHK